jgi:hypothetical protein
LEAPANSLLIPNGTDKAMAHLYRYLGNTLLLLASVGLCIAAAEFIARWVDSAGHEGVTRHVDQIPLAPGVPRAWYFSNPPPLPNRSPVPKDWDELVRRVERSGITEGTRRADMFKAWNSAFVGDPCQHRYLRDAPGHLFIYEAPDGNPRPPYRFLPNTTTPIGLVTNAYGFRGPPVPFVRTPGTVRIAFVGASTTVSSHHLPYSYPEYVGHWLNLWAASKRSNLRFEILNAGREGMSSTDIATIVRTEVAPLRPDLIVYYEGSNQFDLRTLAPDTARLSRPSAVMATSPVEQWLADAAQHFSLVRRFRALFGSADITRGVPANGSEWHKPSYNLVWPAGLDERDPDIGRPDLPVNLGTILADLDNIRAATLATNGELALASFVWLVKDGMVLDPVRHRAILEYLNQGYAPFRYRDMERLAEFQNRVFAKYAASRSLAFLDVAGLMRRDPDLFIDAIHNNETGVRLRGWVVFQELLPLIEKKLSSGAWPKPDPGAGMPAAHPAFLTSPHEINFDCKASPARK